MRISHDNKPLVSVIVAAYNVDKWLCDCLISIKNQTYHKWECIVVNDGSTDKTREIVLEFCALDDRFKLIDKKNEGVSAARNKGLSIAAGHYIQFVDGDDMLPQECIEYNVNQIVNSHVLANDCIIITEKGELIKQTCQGLEGVLDYAEAIKYFLNRKIMSSVWAKFYERGIINNIFFNESLSVGEDLIFNLEMLFKHPKIRIQLSTYPTYKYRIRKSSVSHNKNKARLIKQVEWISALDVFYEKHKSIIDENCLDEYAKNMVRELLFYYSLQGPIKRTEKTLLPLLRKWHYLIEDKTSKEFIQTKFI